MPLTLLQNVVFGSDRQNLTGSGGVGYTVFDVNGAAIGPRSTSGVYQVAPGIYAANVTYPDRFHGQIVWDCPATGSLPVAYAIEQQNVEANDPRASDTWQMVNSVTGSIGSLIDINFGRWRIVNNQMLFYRADNVTLVATFDLFDASGNPTMDGVFERKVH